METICLRCLEKNPDKRFQSANELAAELRRYIAGKPIRSRQIGTFTRALRWSMRNPYAALLFGLVCLIGPVSSVVAWRESANSKQLAAERTVSENLRQIAENRVYQAEQSLKEARSSAYAAYIQANFYMWNPGTTRKLLQDPVKCPVHLQEFAWRHSMYATDRPPYNGEAIRLLKLHTDTVNGIAFSPDQKYLASCGNDGRVVLWDVDTWQPRELRREVGQIPQLPRLGIGVNDADNVYQVVFHPSGKQLLSADHLGRISLWDVETGELVRTVVSAGGKVVKLALSPDGETVAYSKDGLLGFFNNVASEFVLRSLDDPSDMKRLSGNRRYPDTFDFSWDGKLLASGGDDSDTTVRIWSVETGECVKTLEFESSVRAVRFFQDGRLLLVATESQLQKLYWDSGEKDRSFNARIPPTKHVTLFANDSRIAVTDSGPSLRILDAKSGVVDNAGEPGRGVPLTNVTVSPDGKFTALVRRDNTIQITSMGAYGIYRVYRPHIQSVISVDYSSDSKYVFSGSSDHTIAKTNVQSGWREWTVDLNNYVGGIAVHSKSKILAASAGGHIYILSQVDGSILNDWKAHQTFSQCIWLPDGRLATSGDDGYLRIWKDQKLERQFSCGTPLRGLSYSAPDGLIAVGCEDRSVRIFDLAAGKLQMTLENHTGVVASVAFSPDGSRLFSDAGGVWHIWDCESRTLVRSQSNELGVGSYQIASSPDGKNFATTHVVVALWDTLTGGLLCSYNEQDGCEAFSVAFAPDGNSLAYGRANGRVTIRTAIPATSN